MNTAVNTTELADELGISERALDKVYNKLLAIAAMNALDGRNYPVSNSTISTDGRSYKKRCKIYENAGWLEIGDDRICYVGSRIWDEVEPTSVDLLAIWHKASGDDSSYRRRIDAFVRQDELTPNELKYILAQEDTCYARVKGWDIRNGSLRDDVEFVSLEDAQASKYEYESEIIISSAGLIEAVDNILFNERIDRSMKLNIRWAFQRFNILTETEAESVSQTLQSGSNKLPFLGSDDNKYVDWQKNLADSRKALIAEKAHIEEQQRIYLKIDEGITRYGGWDKFLADYREALTAAIIKQDEAEDTK